MSSAAPAAARRAGAGRGRRILRRVDSLTNTLLVAVAVARVVSARRRPR